MGSWLEYLRRGLSRGLPDDRIADVGVNADLMGNLRNLLPFWERHWRKGLLGALLIAVTTLSSLPQPLINRYIIDDVILNRRLQQLALGVVVLAAAKIAEKLAGTFQRLYFVRFEQQVLLDIQGDLLERTLRFPKSFFDDKEVGYLMSRLSTDVQGLRWFFSSTLVYAISNLLRFLGGVGLLVYLEWRLALVALIAIPGISIGVYWFARRLRVIRHHDLEQQANVSRQMQESLASTSLIKAYSSERRTVDRVMSELRESFDIAMEQTTLSSVASLMLQFLPDVTRAIILAAGGVMVIRGDWTLGSLLAFQSYVGYVHGPAQYLGAANLQLQSALAALERVSALYDIVPEEDLDTGQVVEHLCGAVEFRDVSFWYDEREPVLRNVSFSVRPGDRVAIVGPSGVGKTTLVSLIMRFYKPVLGQIRFDGKPASDYELRSLRRRIGYVAQSHLLLSGTIGENLRYGNPEASAEQMESAAKVAGIHDFIVSLSGGYDAQVGEGGVNLSQGQRQRLSIARALVADPDILVLDEPTSALDSIVERSIMSALPELVRGKTVFVIAHRLSTIADADRILLLNEQRLVDEGSHQVLLERNAYYRSLMSIQMSHGADPERHGSMGSG